MHGEGGLSLQSCFQKAEEPVISEDSQHGAEGQDFNQQFGFHTLVIVKQAFIGFLIYFGRILFIIGKMQHSAFQSVSFVDDAQPEGLCSKKPE